MSASENGDSSSGSGMSAPENGNTGSGSRMSAPENGTTGSGSGMSAPENGTTGSGSGMSAPENGTTGSGSGISAPENGTTGSGSGMSAPENGSTGSWLGMSAPENCDTSSEPRKSVSGNEGAERNEGQTSQLKAHLLLAALLEEKCELTAKDANMAQKLFKELSVHLSDLGVLPSESHVEELKEARLEQKKMLTEIILQKAQDPASPVLGCVRHDLQTDIPQNSDYKSKFDELEELGRGGFGAVYKAKHKLDGIEYAVKKIRSKSNETNEKILREVKVLSGLKHCNIVRYHYSWTEEYANSDCADGGSHDYDTSDGSSWSSEHQNCGGCSMNFTVYIHMELCSDNLKHWLNERNNKLSKAEDNIVWKTFEKNYSLIRQILTGVAFIHGSEIIHRDLKPDNIFLSGSGNNLQVKIGDFGLATDQLKNDDGSVVLPPKSQKHTKGVGTKAYASPEQLKSCIYNFKSDMYSIGLIMYEMFHVFNTVAEKSKKFEKLRTKCKCREKFREKLPNEAMIVESLINSVADNRPSAQDLLNLPLFIASQVGELVNLLNSSEPCEGASAVENSDHLSFTAPQLGRIIDVFMDSATNERSSRENIKKHLQDMVSDLKLNPETNERSVPGGSFNSPHTSRERQLEEDELD